MRRYTRRIESRDRYDDLIQDAWVDALQQPQGVIRDLSAWMRAAVRHRAGRVGRRERQRPSVEATAARPECVPSVLDDLVDRSVREAVHQAVAELPEPGRTVLRMRFFDGLSPQEISARLERPASTVRVQLMRAVSALRIKLAKERGAWLRAAWLTLVQQFAGRRGVVAVVVALVLGLLATGFWWPAGTVGVPVEMSTAALPATGEPSETSPEGSADRSPIGARPPVFDTMSVHGHVVDAWGQPLRGARVECRPGVSWESPRTVRDPMIVQTDDHGRFTFPAVRPPFHVTAAYRRRAAAEVATVLSPSARVGEIELVMAPGHPVSGVVTRDGHPVAGHVVECVSVPALRRSGAGRGVIYDPQPMHRVSTDAEGRFRFCGVHPQAAWLQVAGREPIAVKVRPMSVELAHRDRTIRVVGCDGAPVDEVSFTRVLDDAVVAAERVGGAYRVSVPREGRVAMRLAAAGHRPRVHEFSDREVADVQVVLPSLARSTAERRITIELVDAFDGRPIDVEGASVVALDPVSGAVGSTTRVGPGEFELRVAGRGSWEVCPLIPGYSRVRHAVRCSNHLRLPVVRATALRLTVVDRYGAPVPYAQVALATECGGRIHARGRFGRDRWRVSPTGRLRVDGVPCSVLRATITPPGPASPVEFMVDPRLCDEEIVLRLDRLDTRGAKRLVRLDLGDVAGAFELRGVDRTGDTVLVVSGDVEGGGVRWAGETHVTSVRPAMDGPVVSVDDWARDAWYRRYRAGAVAGKASAVAVRIPERVHAMVLAVGNEVRRGVVSDLGTVAFR